MLPLLPGTLHTCPVARTRSEMRLRSNCANDARMLSIRSATGEVPDVSSHGSEYDRNPTPHRRNSSTAVAMCATDRKARSSFQTRIASNFRRDAWVSSSRQAVRPRRSVALAWSTYSPADDHAWAVTNSRSGSSWVSGFCSLSLVETRASGGRHRAGLGCHGRSVRRGIVGMTARQLTRHSEVPRRRSLPLDDGHACASEPERLFAQDGSGTAAEYSRHSQDSTETMTQLSPAVREFLDGLAGIIARDILRSR